MTNEGGKTPEEKGDEVAILKLQTKKGKKKKKREEEIKKKL